jgi:hypothetical protein
MFDSLMVRQTTPSGSADHLDLGHLAEAMLFYRDVHLVLTRGSIPQLIAQCGPDFAVELVENTNVDAIRIDVNLVIATVDQGTERERHWPPTGIKVTQPNDPLRLPADTVNSPDSAMRLPDEAMVIKLFQQATGKTGKGRRMANRFLQKTRKYDLPVDVIHEATARDWQDGYFLGEAIAATIAELAPSYNLPSNIHIKLIRQEDGYYAFNTQLDWTAISTASLNRAAPLTAAQLLGHIANMRQDLHLSAQFASSIAQGPLGARLTRARCTDLTAALDNQQIKIAEFQEVVVGGLADIRQAINSGSCSFKNFLELLKDAEPLRKWLEAQTPDADLIESFFQEVNKRRLIKSPVVKNLRWIIPVIAGLTPLVPGSATVVPDPLVTGPSLATVLTAADQLVLSRFYGGWKPAIFVDDKLRPFVNQ